MWTLAGIVVVAGLVSPRFAGGSIGEPTGTGGGRLAATGGGHVLGVPRHPGPSQDPAAGTSPATPAGGGAPQPGGAVDHPAGWVMTRFGPLSPADRDLLVRVRLAGLWEAPVGQQAQERAGGIRVREVGAHLATDHTALDDQVRLVAAQLGVELPNEPNAEQRGWMTELSSKRGEEYDRTFVARLRAAHGKVFSVVSAVRAGTRNDLVRSFAQTGVNVVMKHMTLLESTGIVDYAALPAPPEPARPSPDKVAAGGLRGGVGAPVIWIVLLAALVAGVTTTVRVIRPR